MADPGNGRDQDGDDNQKKQIWNVAAYALMVADMFIQGTELEIGHIAQSCSVLGFLLSKLLTDRESRERLTLFTDR